MKFLLVLEMKIMHKYIIPVFLAICLFLISSVSYGLENDIPSPPKTPRLVNDFANFLTPQEQFQLEHKLVAFDDSTSTQIAVVIVKSLNGYEINDFATRLFEKWGIGRKGKNNGILVLVKPKTPEENGQVIITTGYGVESFVTDALSKRIVEKEMLPSFRAGQNYEGLDKATSTLMALVKGQFTVDQYMKKKSGKSSKLPVGAFVIIIILVVAFFGRNSSNGRHFSSGGSSIPFWLLMGSMMGSSRSGGGFGDFSSGGGDFGSGGDGCGFGGFGGGSTGGGGASGSW
ncbi:MAG TPA: TPM domain-containing protein [Bacteroidales bacterium]